MSTFNHGYILKRNETIWPRDAKHCIQNILIFIGRLGSGSLFWQTCCTRQCLFDVFIVYEWCLRCTLFFLTLPTGDISACNIRLSVNNMVLQDFVACQKCSTNIKKDLEALKYGHIFWSWSGKTQGNKGLFHNYEALNLSESLVCVTRQV